ncbi:MAG: 1-acyl-sn-glycerol-3-phosphate acyltransferase [Rhodospirillales bacterium]|nr:1-acyl-sn-glycerol-3-phosphate acyltransferase [Rhodospirillales bacterium]
MNFIRSVLFNILFFGGSTILVTLMVLTLPLPRAVLNQGFKFWMLLTMATLKMVAGLSYEVRGRENIPNGPALFASKHQSAWDTGIFFLILEDVSYVLKKQLLSIPFYGWLLKKDKMVAIDRDGGASALKQMVRDSIEVVRDGRQLVIFPEGTRSNPGDKLPYHPGIAAVYKQAGVAVVPVALNSGLFWGRRSFAKKPGKIIIEFLTPIPEGLDRKTFMADLESRIEEASNRLIAEAADHQE